MTEEFLGYGLAMWTALFTFALVIVGGIQAAIYAAIHRRTRILERAWISITSIELDPFGYSSAIGAEPPRAIIGLKNSGGTPAFILRGKVVLHIGVLPDKPTYDSEPWSQAPPSVMVKGEQTNWRHTFDGALITNPTYQQIVEGSQRLYIYGLIEYEDVFTRRWWRLGRKKSHVYRFARAYDPSVKKPVLGAKFAHLHRKDYSDAN